MLTIPSLLTSFSHAVIYTSIHIGFLWGLYLIVRWVGFRAFIQRPLLPINFSLGALAWICAVWGSSVCKVFSGEEVLPEVLSGGVVSLSDADVLFSSVSISTIIALLVVIYYIVFFVYQLPSLHREIKDISLIYKLSKDTSLVKRINMPIWFEESIQKVGKLWRQKTNPLILIITEKMGPLTMSIFHPIIVYPLAALNSLTPEETLTILAHEVNHIRHADFYIGILLRITKLFLPFSPFINQWIKEIQFWQEVNCDKAVLEFYPRNTYASALVKVAEYQQMPLALGAQSSLMRRMQYMYQDYPKGLPGLPSVLKSINIHSLMFSGILLIGFVSFRVAPSPSFEASISPLNLTSIAMPSLAIHAEPLSVPSAVPSENITFNNTTISPQQEIQITKESKITTFDNQIAAWKELSDELDQGKASGLIPASVISSQKEEIASLQHFILESSVWMLSHQYFVPELFDTSSITMTPEEFSWAFESYDNNNAIIREKLKQQIEQNNNLENLRLMANNVKDKVLYLLYVETMLQKDKNGELQ